MKKILGFFRKHWMKFFTAFLVALACFGGYAIGVALRPACRQIPVRSTVAVVVESQALRASVELIDLQPGDVLYICEK